MPGLPRSILLDTPLETDPRGRWILLDRETREEEELAEKIAEFESGLVAFAVDPHDEEVATMWQGKPWHFRKCRDRKDGRPTRLYLPI